MTIVVLQLRDEDLRRGRLVGRVEVIGGGRPIEAGTIRDLADLQAVLFEGIHGGVAEEVNLLPPP